MSTHLTKYNIDRRHKMRLKLKWILGILFIFVLTNGFFGVANHTIANRNFISETENLNSLQQTPPIDNSQCTLERATPKVHLDIEGNQLGFGNTLIPSRLFQGHYSQNLPVGKTLQENINQLQKTIQRHYLFLLNKSTGLKPLPVCHYYIFALRRILI